MIFLYYGDRMKIKRIILLGIITFLCISCTSKNSPYVYTVNIYEEEHLEDSIVTIGNNIPKKIMVYKTPEKAMKVLNDNRLYLKHKIENDVVTESYVEFVITEEMAKDNEGAIPGIYDLRGGTDASYEDNMNIMKEAFGYSAKESRCYLREEAFFTCRMAGMTVDLYQKGYVHITGKAGVSCIVLDSNISYCKN